MLSASVEKRNQRQKTEHQVKKPPHPPSGHPLPRGERGKPRVIRSKIYGCEKCGLVVDPDESALYLTGGRMVGACDLSGGTTVFVACANNSSMSGGLTLVAGSSSYEGFKRGAGVDTMWSDIQGLSIVNGLMYVLDYYGVGTIDLATFATAQYVGVGASNIFGNNLHRRAINPYYYPLEYGWPNFTSFATDGTRGYFYSRESLHPRDITNTYATSSTDDTFYHFDDSISVTENIHCGTDTASLSPEAVVRMYHHAGTTSIATWDTMKTYIAGISSADVASVEAVNWLDLSSSPESSCSWSEGEAVGDAFGSTSSLGSGEPFTDFVSFDGPPGSSQDTTVGELKTASSVKGMYSGERVVPKAKTLEVDSSQLKPPPAKDKP